MYTSSQASSAPRSGINQAAGAAVQNLSSLVFGWNLAGPKTCLAQKVHPGTTAKPQS